MFAAIFFLTVPVLFSVFMLPLRLLNVLLWSLGLRTGQVISYVFFALALCSTVLVHRMMWNHLLARPSSGDAE